MLATWLDICASILFPVPVVRKTHLLRNLLIIANLRLMLQVEQEAQLMLTTGAMRLAVSRGQQTWYHFWVRCDFSLSL